MNKMDNHLYVEVEGSSTNQRGRAWRRHQRRRVIRNKHRFLEASRGRTEFEKGWGFTALGKFAKGKIHCSCPYCQTKTKTHGYKKSERARMGMSK